MSETRVRVESIRVEGRHRRQFGDIAALAADIQANGLIHAIALTVDNRLIAGERRLRAVQVLGWTEVPVRYLKNITDAVGMLRAERSENAHRLDMAPSELASLGAAIEELEKPRADARKTAGQANGRAKQFGHSVHGLETVNRMSESSMVPDGTTAEAVADALGISESTYRRARAIHKVAANESLPEAERVRAQRALDEMDRTDTVMPVYSRWRAGECFESEPEMPTVDTAVIDAPAVSDANGKRPTKPRRALPDGFRDGAYQLTKTVERLERLVLDDRFPRNAEQVARIVRGDLLRAADLLAAVIDRIPTATTEVTQ